LPPARDSTFFQADTAPEFRGGEGEKWPGGLFRKEIARTGKKIKVFF